MSVSPAGQTTAMLFGNDTAISSIRARKPPADGSPYASGSVLALVTWAQREDPHWFGARIPFEPKSIEFLQVSQPAQPNVYRRFMGRGLAEDHPQPDIADRRARYLLNLAPAVLP